MTVDLSKLPAPSVIEEQDYATILADLKADLILKNPDLTDALDNPAEPVTQQLEVAAYREMIIRQEFNDRIKGLLLAMTWGGNLDHVGVTYFNSTERLVIDPGDPAAVPPVAPTYESDDAYRARLLLVDDAYSTAGPDEAYIFHATSADGNVKDISVTSPAAVQVVVTVLSHIGDGAPDAPLLAAVETALGNDVRPLTDQVTVQAATIINYTVNATLTVYAGADQATIQAAAEASLIAWIDSQHRLGRDITVSGVHAALKVEGVHDVTLNNTIGTDLVANLAVTDTEAAYSTGVTVDIGGVGE